MKILIAEPLAPAAVGNLKSVDGWEVVVSNPKEYGQHLADCDALIVRSAVKVTRDVLARAPKLSVIGRAGVGVDNVDVDAATEAGVLVMNTPGGNAVSVAEHALAMMLGLARSVPQASARTKSGIWDKKRFLGNELRGKTLGVVGLGNIGREVVRRAKAFEMRVIGTDPFVSSQLASDLGVELVSLDTLYAQSDYISLHVGVTDETRGMINAASLARMKHGVRIINCARGELIDQQALTEALASGQVAGAGLDVFDPEPPKEGDPLLALENVIATPHIGGSTEEAQEIVGMRIAQQLIDYLRSGVAVNAVNMPAMSADQFKAVGPWLHVAGRIGNFASYVAEGNPSAVRVTYRGRIAEMNTQLIRNAALAGILARSMSPRPNIVNAMPIAAHRGLSVDERHEKRSAYTDSVQVELETDAGKVVVEGSLILGKPRLIQVDGIMIESALSGHVTFLRNRDVPGVIGHIGAVMGRNRINIANFALGRREAAAGTAVALAIVETDHAVSDSVLAELRTHEAILQARRVEF